MFLCIALIDYNISIFQHIQELLANWEDQIKECHIIFYRCPKNNLQTLFGGQNPPLKKTDNRLRTIPFSTKQASFSECKRVHRLLTQIFVYSKFIHLTFICYHLLLRFYFLYQIPLMIWKVIMIPPRREKLVYHRIQFPKVKSRKRK